MVTLAAQAIVAAGVNGAIESIQYWNPVTGAWATSPPSVPFGSLIGVKAAMRNTGAGDQKMNMVFTLRRPDGLNKSFLIAPVVTVAPNGTYEQGWTDFSDVAGAWTELIELYGEPKILILRPNTVGDLTELVIGGTAPAPSNWMSVDEEVADEDVTYVFLNYIYYSGEFRTDLYGLQDTSQAGTIKSVKAYVRCRRHDPTLNGFVCTAIKTGGTVYYGSVIEHPTLTTNWATFSTAYYVNPNTGQPWTWAEINALQAGVSLRIPSPNYPVYCTQVYVEVEVE